MSDQNDEDAIHLPEIPDITDHKTDLLTGEKNQQETVPGAVFHKFGYFTMWILPTVYMILFYGIIVFATPVLFVWLIFVIASLGHEVWKGHNLPYISEGIYFLAKLTFGFEPEEENHNQIRLWWFVITVPFLSAFIVSFVYFAWVIIIPFILLSTKRQLIVSKIFSITFLPRSDLLNFTDQKGEVVEEKTLSHSSQYFQFYGNTTKRLGNALLTILGFTILLSLFPFFAIRLSLAFDDKSIIGFFRPSRNANFDFNILKNSLRWGLIGIIPYLIWSIPYAPKYRLTRLVGSKLSRSFVNSASGSVINKIPWFKGDYYVELNSRVMDLDYNFSFFEIFKRGRLIPIVLTPIAIMSLFIGNAVRRTIRNIGSQSIQPNQFWLGLNKIVFGMPLDRGIFGFALIIGPLLFSILLPLVLALHDAEIKRAVWDYDESIGITDEITTVEDLGITVNNLVSAVVGIGTIASIYFFLNGLGASIIDSLIYTTVIIGISGVLVLPGVFAMVYYYMWSGDHAYSVNYLRYHLSHSDKFSVGTITKEYFPNRTLDLPPEHIAQELNLK